MRHSASFIPFNAAGFHRWEKINKNLIEALPRFFWSQAKLWCDTIAIIPSESIKLFGLKVRTGFIVKVFFGF